MADKAEFLQAINDAILDADSLERFINGSDSETVITRLSAKYPTIRKMIARIDDDFKKLSTDATTDYQALFERLMEDNNLAGRFKTAEQLQVEGAALSDGAYALVADDTDDKNGIYIKESEGWVRSKYDPFRKSKELVDDLDARYGHALDNKLDNKLDKVVIGEQSKLFAFSDAMGNEALTIDDKGVAEATDFKGENVALSDLEQIAKVDVGYNKSLNNSVFNLSDSMGNSIIDVAEDGHFYIPNINNGMSVQQALLQASLDGGGSEGTEDTKDSRSGGSTAHAFRLMQRYSSEQDVGTKQSLDKLVAVADKQKTPFRQDVRASNYGDGANHHIQRIPCIFRHKDNEALLFFNRGLNGYDGDANGAELFKSVVKWDSNYKITEVRTPVLFYSLQSVEAGGSVKHPTIGRLRNGNLIMLIDRRIMSSTSTQYMQEYSISTDNGDTWQAWRVITLNNTFIQPGENTTLVLGTGLKILTLGSGRLVAPVYTTTESVRRMAYMYSDDNGASWSLSNPVGGSESIARGIYFGESPIIQNSKGELISHVRSLGSSKKQLVISRDNGETLEYLGTVNDFTTQVCQSASATLLDSIVVLSTQRGSGRVDFSLKFSLNDGYNFNFIEYKPYPKDSYKGYASIEILNNAYILMAVEGTDNAQTPNKSENIDLLMINLSEVIENGVIL